MSDEAFDDPSLMNAVNNYSPPDADIPVASPSEQAYLATGNTPANVDYSWADELMSGSTEIGSIIGDSSIAQLLGGSQATAPAATGESNIGTMLKDTWSGTKDILNAPGNSVGAMLLAMALKGIGNIGTQKQNNRALDIQQGHLDLARQKEKNLQASRTGNFTVAAMQPKKAKFDGGMIYSQLTGGKP